LKKEFSNYWFSTATPTFLINLIKKMNYSIENFEYAEARSNELGAFEIENIPLKTLLFQTGYLTLAGKNPETGNYLLTYPNKETIDSLFGYIFTSMTEQGASHLDNTVVKLLQALKNADFNALHDILTSFYAGIPNTITIDQEKYYQTIFYVLCKIADADIIVESATTIGIIDAVIQTKKECFIIELKINDTADAALKQIKERKYYQAYQGLHKNIILVGISFDIATRNIDEIKHEALELH
jgi:PD-(D/E)XK nuclease superfamily